MNLERYTKLKSEADQRRREADRAEGALQQLMGQLERDFGCRTLEEADARLAELEEEARGLEEQFDAALAAFEREWGERLREER